MKTSLSNFSIAKVITRMFFFMLVALVASCSDDDSGYVRITDEYCIKTELDCSSVIPEYHIGDYWIGDDGVKTEVTGTTVIDGKTYYVLEWYPLDGTGDEGTGYERHEGSKIYFRGDEMEEWLAADFSEGATEWEAVVGDDVLIHKLESSAAEITVNEITFSNSYVIEITWVDYPTYYLTQTYLPGIGLVVNHFSIDEVPQTGSWDVIEFKIDGQVYKIK